MILTKSFHFQLKADVYCLYFTEQWLSYHGIDFTVLVLQVYTILYKSIAQKYTTFLFLASLKANK